MSEFCSTAQFRSFFMGGFECSTHLRPDGVRLDLIASTCHDRFAELDYRRLQSQGLYTCRDGFRWHLIEKTPGDYDFSSALPLLRAAQRTGIQVIWDLLHYGWPEDIDVFKPEFVDRFARFCNVMARLVAQETEGPFWFVPVNEPSFLSWAGGQMAIFPPFTHKRGHEFKEQLIRCAIAGTEAVRDEIPAARFLFVDPLINIVTAPGMPQHLCDEAAGYCRAQFDCLNMLGGWLRPELGGDPKYLDVIGCNYYVHNQWVYGGKFIERTDPRYRPLHLLLNEVWLKYQRPLVIAETGIEDERRPDWLRYIGDECEAALRMGAPLQGVCLYPVMNHPGWADDRHCHNGLWDYCNAEGHREIYRPLAEELRIQQARIQSLLSSPDRGREAAGTFA